METLNCTASIFHDEPDHSTGYLGMTELECIEIEGVSINLDDGTKAQILAAIRKRRDLDRRLADEDRAADAHYAARAWA